MSYTQKEIISSVDGVYNGVVIESDFVKEAFLQGEGAGSQNQQQLQ